MAHEKGVLVIYEKEEEYAARLSGYLSRSQEFPYRVAMFTNPTSLQEYLSEEQVDVLLLGEECVYEVESRQGKCRQILLTEEQQDGREEPWIFKYQSAGNIMREITAYAARPNDMEGQTGPEIHTVFATRSGQARADYAHQLVQELSRQGEVLYVNMDLFPPEGVGSEGEWKGMSEVVYYLKQGGERMKWKIKGLIAQEGKIRILRPVHCSMDLMELTPDDVVLLFQTFRDMQELDHIVLEVGFYNTTMLEICRFSHRIHLVTPGGAGYTESTDYFLGQIALMQHEGLERKVEIVRYGAGEERRTAPTAVGETGFFPRMDR